MIYDSLLLLLGASNKIPGQGEFAQQERGLFQEEKEETFILLCMRSML